MCVRFREQVGDEIFTGLTVVAFSLQDISEADGGFACIPSASHSPLHAALYHTGCAKNSWQVPTRGSDASVLASA